MNFLKRFDLCISHCQSYSNRNNFLSNKINNGSSVNRNVSEISNVADIIGSCFCN